MVIKEVRNFLFLVYISFSLNADAQFFEGCVVYKNTYTSKLTNVTDKKFSTMLGAEQKYYIKVEIPL